MIRQPPEQIPNDKGKTHAKTERRKGKTKPRIAAKNAKIEDW
jgi:hypothetical protein